MLTSVFNPPVIQPDCRMVWIEGPPGCGKSYAARVTIPKILGVEPVLKSAYEKWWPVNPNSSDYVVVEDIDHTFIEHHKVEPLKLICDRYPFEAFFKGGSLRISPALVVFTSNYTYESILESISLDKKLLDALTRRRVLSYSLEPGSDGGPVADIQKIDMMNAEIVAFYKS